MTFEELPKEVQDTFRNAFYGRHDINLMLLQKNDILKEGGYLQAMAVQIKINNLYTQAANAFVKKMEKEVQNIEMKDLDLPEEDKHSINTLALKMYMCCDIIDGAVKDINSILHRTDKDLNFEQFDDIIGISNSVKAKLKFFSKNALYLHTETWGRETDVADRLIENKAKKVYNKYKNMNV